VPVLALTGQAATTAIGSEYLVTLMHPAGVRHAIDRAVRGALSERTVTALIFPKDLQEEPAVELPLHLMNYNASSVGLERARIVPHDDALRHAAEVLNAGSKVAILVGAGTI
jgi:pyruvate dehydrogenase (quinone)